jgi:hypothetical protein
MKPESGWSRTSSHYLFQSRWYAVRQDVLTSPDGTTITYTVVEHPGFVVIVPLLPDGRVVMERIYRYPLQRVNLECPSGGLDGEEPEMAARRERGGNRLSRGPDELAGKYAASSGISDENIFLATTSAPMACCGADYRDIDIELIPPRSAHKSREIMVASAGVLLAVKCSGGTAPPDEWGAAGWRQRVAASHD